MDRFPLIPAEEIPLDQMQVLRAEWMVYSLMMAGNTRRYIPDAIEHQLSQFVRGRERLTPGTELRLGDFGSGNGMMTQLAIEVLAKSKLDSKILLIDRSAPALSSAWEMFQAQGFTIDGHSKERVHSSLSRETQTGHQQTLIFHHEDITKTSLPDDSLDAVTTINVPHHLTCSEVVGAGNEMHRALTKGGLAIIVDTAPLSENPFPQLTRFIIDRVITVAKAEERARNRGLPVTPEFRRGAELFVDDGRRAFEQALSLSQLTELLEKSQLGLGIVSARYLKSPHPLLRYFFPVLNLVTASK